jgi:uncharacterized protein YlaN (UPF0358 family)
VIQSQNVIFVEHACGIKKKRKNLAMPQIPHFNFVVEMEMFNFPP